METKELKINIPEGYEIDREASTFECIKFKPVEKSKFSDYDGTYPMAGYYINGNKTSFIGTAKNNFERNKDVFQLKNMPNRHWRWHKFPKLWQMMRDMEVLLPIRNGKMVKYQNIALVGKKHIYNFQRIKVPMNFLHFIQ